MNPESAKTSAETCPHKRDLVLLTGRYPKTVKQELLNAVAAMDYKILPADIGAFKSGERFCELYPKQSHLFNENKTDIAGANVHIVLHMNNDTNTFFVDAMNAIETVKEYGAQNVHVIMPFAPYARQDRKFDKRFTSLMAKSFPKHLKYAGADRVTTFDVHSKAAEAYYTACFGEKNVHFLSMADTLGQVAQSLCPPGTLYTYGGPDGGNKPNDVAQIKAHRLRDRLHGWTDYPHDHMFLIDKEHVGVSETKVLQLKGDVAGTTAMLLDDMGDTGGTIEKAIDALEDAGVDAVQTMFTHAIASKNCLNRLSAHQPRHGSSAANFIVTSDTILGVHDKMRRLPTQEQRDRVKIVSAVPTIAQALKQRF